jgi:hypothetical protein
MSDLSSQINRGYQRRRYLVDHKLQLQPILVVLGLGCLLAMVVGGATYLGAGYLVEKQLYSPHIAYGSSGEFLLPYLGWLNAGFAFILIFFGFFLVRLYLGRTAGSLLRLQAHLDRLRREVHLPSPIHFRHLDPLQPVAAAANRFTASLGQQRLVVRQELEKALQCLEHAGDEMYQGRIPKTELQQAAVLLTAARKNLERQVP